MNEDEEACFPPVAPALIEAWARGRALARGSAVPVRDGEAFRCDTGLPDERARYVFASAGPAVRALAERIVAPCIFLKVCARASVVAPLLPARWAIRPAGFLMSCDGSMTGAAPAPPPGYRIETVAEGGAFAVTVRDGRGVAVASGKAGRIGAMLVYDQIGTDAAYRRRGFGRVVMKALEALGDGADGPQMLVATEDGRALYRTLGWSLLSCYTTAVIPG